MGINEAFKSIWRSKSKCFAKWENSCDNTAIESKVCGIGIHQTNYLSDLVVTTRDDLER